MPHALITDVGLRPLSVSLTATSFVLFGTAMLELVGPIAVVRKKLGTVDLSKRDKARIFNSFFYRIAPFIVGGTTLATVSAIYAGLTTRNPDVRKWSYAAAASSATLTPYTFFVLMPINRRLMALGDKAEKGMEFTASEDQDVDQLVEQWQSLHVFRFVPYLAGWVSALLAFHAGVAAV